jgi:hypothetical protein
MLSKTEGFMFQVSAPPQEDSTLDVRRSVCSLFQPREISYKRRLWPKNGQFNQKKTTFL